MRCVAVKSAEQQAAGLEFRARDLVVRQRTQLINAIRGHLAEYGWVAPRGTAHMTMLADRLEDEEMISTLPEAARPMFKLMVDLLGELGKQIAVLDREIARRAKEDDAARGLMTIPGIGPIAATARSLRRSRRSAKVATLCYAVGDPELQGCNAALLIGAIGYHDNRARFFEADRRSYRVQRADPENRRIEAGVGVCEIVKVRDSRQTRGVRGRKCLRQGSGPVLTGRG